MSSFNYTTKEGETWGKIAWDNYNSMGGIATIMNANPHVPADPVIPAGTVLIIPIIDDTDDAIITKNTPPWA